MLQINKTICEKIHIISANWCIGWYVIITLFNYFEKIRSCMEVSKLVKSQNKMNKNILIYLTPWSHVSFKISQKPKSKIDHPKVSLTLTIKILHPLTISCTHARLNVLSSLDFVLWNLQTQDFFQNKKNLACVSFKTGWSSGVSILV